MYPEYMPQEDAILSAKEQPLPTAASPTADSPGYVPESDPEEVPEEDDEDPEEDPADYPTDRDDHDDDDDDDDDEDEVEDEEEEEEEHPAPANSVPPVHRMTARISIRDEPSISLPPRDEVERLLALTTPPPIPSPPFPASPPASLIRPLGYRAAMIRLRAETLLSGYHAVIVCAKKIVRIPFGDETLIVRANITATKDKDKSKGKRLEDVLVVQEFPEVFPE
ncbi:hypothetical protein Tco_0141766, partial [Tanacetum coccineum]